MKVSDDDEWKYEITEKDVADEPVLRWLMEHNQPMQLPDEIKLSFRDAGLEIVHRCARSPERTLALRKLVDAQTEVCRAFQVTPR